MRSKTSLWAGWLFTILPALVLLGSASMKLLGVSGLAAGFEHLGWPMTLAVVWGFWRPRSRCCFSFPRRQSSERFSSRAIWEARSRRMCASVSPFSCTFSLALRFGWGCICGSPVFAHSSLCCDSLALIHVPSFVARSRVSVATTSNSPAFAVSARRVGPYS